MISDSNILAVNFILIVESRICDGNSSHMDGFHHGDWSERPGSADLNDDVLNGCLGLFRLKLRRRRPPRASCNESQFFLDAQIINFHDDAVDIERKLMTERLDLVIILNGVFS